MSSPFYQTTVQYPQLTKPPEQPPADPPSQFGQSWLPQPPPPPRGPRRAQQYDACAFVKDTAPPPNWVADWHPRADQPTYRKRSVAGLVAETSEPTLREGSASWRPTLPQPSPRRRPPHHHHAAALEPTLFPVLLTTWQRPAGEPVRRRPRVEAGVQTPPPELTFADLRFFVPPSVPTRRLPGRWTQPAPYPLPPPLDPGPAQWSMRPLDPPRRRVPAQPAACEPSAVWFWDVRADGWFRPAATPVLRSARTPPEGTAQQADLLFREPPVALWLAEPPPPPPPRRAVGFPAVAQPDVMAFEVSPAGWAVALPPLPVRRRGFRPGFAACPAEALGWVVTPERWLSGVTLPAGRPAVETPAGLVWAIYPGWDVPPDRWWTPAGQPVRALPRVAAWLVPAMGRHEALRWAFVHGVTLVWRGHDAGRTWKGGDR